MKGGSGSFSPDRHKPPIPLTVATVSHGGIAFHRQEQLEVHKWHQLSLYVISNLIQFLLSEELILDKVILIDEHLQELGLRIVEVSLRIKAV